jgi:hypothetical protein
MLYKVTPVLPEPEKKQKQPREPGAKRKKRGAAVYDADGNEVLITLMCLKCRKMRPLAQFGLRKMADGAIRNQPWCRKCRSESRPELPAKVADAEAVAGEADAAAAAAEAITASAPANGSAVGAPAPLEASHAAEPQAEKPSEVPPLEAAGVAR